jgi:phage terminase large subunit-like protein
MTLLLNSTMPRWGTPRRAERKTRGVQLRKVAEMMGFELFPWQAYVADVALECDDRGDYFWTTAGATLGRQNGKSKLVSARIAMECLQPGHFAAYTAQDRNMARHAWDEHVSIMEQSPKISKQIAKIIYRNGSEMVRFKNGSSYSILTPSNNGGRGRTLDLVIIDEALTHTLDIDAALRPTLATRRNGQLWLVSNAGDPQSSELLKHYRALGHESIINKDSGLAWFEWAPMSDEFNVHDEDVWYQAIPSLGLPNGVTLEAVRQAAQMNPAHIFAREWLNVWPSTSSVQVISDAAWTALTDTSTRIGNQIVFGLDVTFERHKATIAAAGRIGNKVPIEIVERGDGVRWVIDRCKELSTKWRAPIVIDAGSPAGSFIDAMQRDGINVIPIGRRDFAQGCGTFYDLVQDGRIAHDGDPLLHQVIKSTSRRPLGEAWAWDRKSCDEAIDLVAATLAVFGIIHKEPEKELPRSRIY